MPEDQKNSLPDNPNDRFDVYMQDLEINDTSTYDAEGDEGNNELERMLAERLGVDLSKLRRE